MTLITCRSDGGSRLVVFVRVKEESMRTNSIAMLTAGVLLVVGLTQGAAMASLTPITATTTDPIAYASLGSAVGNVIDGSTAAVPWLALGYEGRGTWAGPYNVTFDLGAAYDLTGFNLWNNGGGIGNDGEGIKDFTLTFYDPLAAVVGSFTGSATDLESLQTFAFAASNVQKVDLEITTNHSEIIARQYAIFHEVSFEGTPHVVPVPGAALLALVGLGCTSLRLRRKQS